MFNRELVKGSTSLLILQLLDDRDMYGYELVKEMDRRSKSHFQVKEGTLYPALHKLEKQGYISYYWQDREKGPARKYYKITVDGQEILKERTSEWHRYVQVMNNLIGKKET
ncbi:PadR family transcriptional regulator, regulatory protein PadR [Halobacillus karajensis]|uniref:Lineage-specific thermal regulator protein n=1 Tax=Halobacillus karajensis TaxID=195088 RepID=A0A024P969_9BACI|nr:PadR family transcriptional regulator [Halobacillus karajensis]CDQ21561.1 lineage-specific thermal regulator protein [Halobacillus karajensis]CDQ25495.1 lineage-specific thermal regulator protein [Halobacillus karajensis]CDQ28974.1 lineage-specific thermal regulator protein [Halobacillus karajensis]SEI08954.1 PadR family transcriptional regulator, regulatory protein PadR [Halobacillus karajensis]